MQNSKNSRAVPLTIKLSFVWQYISMIYFSLNLNLCNFADDNTIYACNTSFDALVAKLESSAEAVIKWFDYNCMKLNESK